MKTLELPIMGDLSTPSEALEKMIEIRRAGVVIKVGAGHRLIEANDAIDAVANKINVLANIHRFVLVDFLTGNVLRTEPGRISNLVELDQGTRLAKLTFDNSLEYLADRLESAVPVRRCSNLGEDGPHFYPPTSKSVLIDPNTCWCGFKLI